MKAMSGLRVLETASYVAGPYCGKLLSDYGAEVTKIEPPGGDAARRSGPFPGDVPDIEASGLFIHLNSGKRSVVLDLSKPDDVRSLRSLAERADLIIDDGTIEVV